MVAPRRVGVNSATATISRSVQVNLREPWWIGDVEIDPFASGDVLYVTGATIWGSDDADAQDSGKPTHWTPRMQKALFTATSNQQTFSLLSVGT